MRIAAIDCGTNTVLLLVAEHLPRQPPQNDGPARSAGPRLRAVAEFLEMPRLGQDLDRTGRLHPDAMQRTLDALARQKQRALEFGAERLIAVGTESLRAAQNGAEFLTRVKEVLGETPLRVISGQEEARLSFRSVAESLPPPPAGIRSVLDIGGGSTELVVGSGRTPSAWASVPIGSVRLTERLLKSDPPTPGEKQALVSAIDTALAGLPESRGELVALAGTATTIGALHLGLLQHDSAQIDGMRMPVSALSALCDRLGGLSVAERKLLPGLDSRRADVIYAGGMILLRAALRSAVAEVIVSDRGVRWGALEELLDDLTR
jgi:exopolyphosphatase/guanosine-5'-triphosphate,3'-diphosphate pyrophosphatase